MIILLAIILFPIALLLDLAKKIIKKKALNIEIQGFS